MQHEGHAEENPAVSMVIANQGQCSSFTRMNDSPPVIRTDSRELLEYMHSLQFSIFLVIPCYTTMVNDQHIMYIMYFNITL